MTRVLVHTGFAKAGSTYLQEWFDRHPRIRFRAHSLGGFTNVFDLADTSHDDPGREYDYYVTSNELLGAGGKIPHGCPLYSYRLLRETDMRSGQRNVVRHLRALYPGARAVVVTRGFEGIIRSLYSQYVKLGGRRPFPAFLERYTPLLDQWLDVDFNLDLHREAFGSGLIILPYELLAEDADRFFEVLESFLGIDPCPEMPRNRNPSLGPDRLYWYALLSRWLVTPFAELFRPERAAKVYTAWGFGVVQRDRLGGPIRLVNALARRQADLTFPEGFLDRFRGRADSLAGSELHRPYLDRYLLSVPADARAPGHAEWARSGA